MKLELKHLSPYLPYGLKCQAMGEVVEGTEYNDPSEPKIFILNGLVNGKASIMAIQKSVIDLDELFPILRPMEDLHPDELKKLFGCEFEYVNANTYVWNTKTMDSLNILCYPIWMSEFLFKHHYDVFGLIEERLAIDINTIK